MSRTSAKATKSGHPIHRLALRVEKLAMLTQALRRGKRFTITRLTVLKSLCADPVLAVRFGLYLTRKARPRAPMRFRPLVNRAIRLSQTHLKNASAKPPEAMWDALSGLRASQNEVEHHHWVDVRIIHSKEALLAEYALKCVLQPKQSAYWGYQMAAVFAERYDPRYGTGLIPASASAVEDIVRFWSRQHPRRSGGR